MKKLFLLLSVALSMATAHAEQEEVYDYVVVGMGAAGVPLAFLLSQEHSVLGIEAGDDHDKDKEVVSLQTGPHATNGGDFWNKLFWPILTVPQKFAGDVVHHHTAGRALGGGSTVFGKQHMRGDLVSFADLGPRFEPKLVLDVMCALETYHGTTDDSTKRGYKGSMMIYQAPRTRVSDKFAEVVSKVIGVPIVEDHNAVDYPAVASQGQFVCKEDLTRSSVSIEYLKNRKHHVQLSLRSTATKILFEGNLAVGVEYIQDGVCKCVRARKELIISCGAYSCDLLKRSGIGPKAELEPLGIQVLSDLPVGLFTKTQVTIQPILLQSSSADVNDRFSQLSSGWPAQLALSSNLKRRAWQMGAAFSNGRVRIVCQLNKPESIGNVTLYSRDPLQFPRADPRFLEDKRDMVALKEIARASRAVAEEMVKSDPSYKIISDLSIYNSEEALENYIRRNLGHTHHNFGFCRMGHVVDKDFKPFGTQNLRVIDLSIAGEPSSSNSHNPAMVIGVIGYIALTGDADWRQKLEKP